MKSLETLSVSELKAMAYDQLRNIEKSQMLLTKINQLISQKEQGEDKTQSKNKNQNKTPN